MNSEKLLSRHTLKNGLLLEFWDLSRPMLGDRCQAVVEARVAVAVTADTLPAELRPQLGQVSAALGKEVVFSQQEVRTFVETGAAPGLLKLIEEQLLGSLQDYLGHPEFASRLIRKRYADRQKETGWQH